MTVRRPLPSYRDLRVGAGDAPDCATCGICCEKMGGAVCVRRFDVERWLREGRRDILKHVDHEVDAAGELLRYSEELWRDPDGGPVDLLDRCPFLTCTWDAGFRCAIHATRPFPCRDFEFGGERCRDLWESYVRRRARP